MSIIYEALKKVDASNIKDLSVKTDKDKDKKAKPRVYLVYLLVVCLGLLLASIFFDIFTKSSQKNVFISLKKEPAALKTNLPPIASEAKDNEEQKVTPQKRSPPSLVLNGVFYSEDKGYALINNQIVKKGDVIEGLTVVRIGSDSVELKSGESTIKLSPAP